MSFDSTIAGGTANTIDSDAVGGDAGCVGGSGSCAGCVAWIVLVLTLVLTKNGNESSLLLCRIVVGLWLHWNCFLWRRWEEERRVEGWKKREKTYNVGLCIIIIIIVIQAEVVCNICLFSTCFKCLFQPSMKMESMDDGRGNGGEREGDLNVRAWVVVRML